MPFELPPIEIAFNGSFGDVSIAEIVSSLLTTSTGSVLTVAYLAVVFFHVFQASTC